jgi:glycosyltransferase involved in cell wall biosynthesis
MVSSKRNSPQIGELTAAKPAPVVVCFPFVGDKLGGSHVSVHGLIKNLDRARFKPLVVLHETDGPVAEYYRREGITFEPAPAKNRLERAKLRNAAAITNVFRTLPAFVRFLKAHNAAIVHTNDGRAHVAWGLAARLAGAKLLWHHRGDDASIGMHLVAPWLANKVASVSTFSAPKPGIFSAAHKATVIHSPFDVAKSEQFDRCTSRAMILKELNAPPETNILGFVGTLVNRKRPLVFVEMIAALRKLTPERNFAGLFLGSALNGLDQTTKEKAKDLGVADLIHFMGYRHPGEAWIAGMDALIVPAVNEPLGRTLVEAMLLGTPVVATDSGGNPEAISDRRTGMIVPPDDPMALAKAYLAISNNQVNRDAMVEAARQDARVRFSSERHVEAVSNLYDAMLARQGDR